MRRALRGREWRCTGRQTTVQRRFELPDPVADRRRREERLRVRLTGEETARDRRSEGLKRRMNVWPRTRTWMARSTPPATGQAGSVTLESRGPASPNPTGLWPCMKRGRRRGSISHPEREATSGFDVHRRAQRLALPIQRSGKPVGIWRASGFQAESAYSQRGHLESDKDA